MPRKPKKTSAKKLPDSAPIIQSTVRPQDVAVRRWAKRSEVENLLRRYSKWVKVAVTLRAGQLAALPVRFYRDGADAGEKSMRWRSRMVKDRERSKIIGHAGATTNKSVGYIDELEEITDPRHPANALMNRPNPWLSGPGLVESVEASSCMAGNAYAAVVVPSAVGYPTELWPLPPQHVRVIPSKTDWIEGYQYGRGTEVERFYKPDEVIPFKRPSPKGDPWYGEGDMEACVPDADLSFAMSQVALALLDNGIMPGIVFCGEDWTSDQRSEARAEFEREHQGVAKIGRSMFISGKVKLDKVQIGQYEVELLQGSDDHAREVVAACFGVPLEYMTLRPGGLGDGKGVPGNQFQTLTLLPAKRRLEDDLNGYLMPYFRAALGDDSLVCCIDSPVVEDVEATERRAVALFVGNIAFRDEVRSMVSMDPIDDGAQVWAASLAAPVMATGMQLESGKPGDVPAGETTNATVTEDAAAPQGGPDVQATALNGAQVASLQEMVRAAAAKEIPLEAVTPMMQISFPNTPAALIQTLVTSLTGFEPPKPEPVMVPGAPPNPAGGGGDPTESGDIPPKPSATGEKAVAPPLYPDLFKPVPDTGAGRKDDDKFQSALYEWFRSVSPVIQDAVRAYVESGMAEPIRDILSSDPIELTRFVRIVQPFTRQAMMAGNGSAMANLSSVGRVGDAAEWVDVPPVPAMDWLKTNDVKLAESTLATIDKTVRDTVGRTLSESVSAGLEQGDKIEQIQNRVAEVMGPTSSRYAAERIARTESTRALAQGRMETYKESGEVEGLRWLLSGDPCPDCLALADKVVEIGEPFAVDDYGPIYAPPRHPNCSCDYTPVFKSKETP